MKNENNHARHHVGLILALVGLVGAAALVLGPARISSARADASWIYTGNLNTDRAFHTATLLPNGKVLVAGGSGWGRYWVVLHFLSVSHSLSDDHWSAAKLFRLPVHLHII